MYSELDENVFYQLLGENIRLLRERKRVKQESLAVHLGFSRVSISNIETGKQKIQLHSLIRLANYFKVTVDEIMPLPRYERKDINLIIEKKIADTEISQKAEALERVKDFIRISTSNNSSHVPG